MIINDFDLIHLIKEAVSKTNKDLSYLKKPDPTEVDFFLSGYKPFLFISLDEIEEFDLNDFPKYHDVNFGTTRTSGYLLREGILENEKYCLISQNASVAEVFKNKPVPFGVFLGYIPHAIQLFEECFYMTDRDHTYNGINSLGRRICNYHGLEFVVGPKDDFIIRNQLDFIYGLGRDFKIREFQMTTPDEYIKIPREREFDNDYAQYLFSQKEIKELLRNDNRRN